VLQVNTEIEKLEDQINVIRSEMTRYADGGREADRTKSTALREVRRRPLGLAVWQDAHPPCLLQVEDRLAGSETQAEMYEKR
jgi:hypothetical protein